MDGAKEEEEEEDEIPKTPIPQKWECLGSDREVKEQHFKDKRELVKMSRVHLGKGGVGGIDHLHYNS